MRASKYDDFIFLDPINNKIFHICWDMKFGTKDDWMHYDGKE